MYKDDAATLEAVRKPIYIKKFLIVGGITFVLMLPIAFFGMFVAPLVGWIGGKMWSKAAARSALDKMLAQQAALQERLLSGSTAPQYFNVDVGNSICGIAVDPASKTVTTLTWIGPPDKDRQTPLPESSLRVVTLPAANLKDWSAMQPGLTLIEPTGRASTSAMLDMQAKNARAAAQQRNETGLLLHTDMLDCPEIFLNFNYEIAKPWVLMLSKLSDGTIPPIHSNQAFPKDA